LKNEGEQEKLNERPFKPFVELKEGPTIVVREEQNAKVQASEQSAAPLSAGAALAPVDNAIHKTIDDQIGLAGVLEKGAPAEEVANQNTEVLSHFNEPVFNRSEPFVLYLHKAKARIALALPVIFIAVFSLILMILSIQQSLPLYVFLPLAAPAIFSVLIFMAFFRQRQALFTIDSQGISLNLPFFNLGKIGWEEINSVEVINRGSFQFIRLNVQDRGKLTARLGAFSKLNAALTANPFEISDQVLPISAAEVLDHIAAYAAIYGPKVKIFKSHEANSDSADKSRVLEHALKMVAAGAAILTIYFFTTQAIHTDYRQDLERNLLSDLKQGDLYSGVRDKAKLLAFDHKDKEALATYMDYYDHSRADPSQSGVRNSFVTAEIVALGKSYPPALDALKQHRNEREIQILANQASVDDIKEWYSANLYLKETARTSEVLLKLQQSGAKITPVVLSVVNKYSQ